MSEAEAQAGDKIQLEVYNQQKEKVGEVELNPKVFGAEIKPHILHQVVVWQEACHRRGTASTKTRAEVRGGGAKPWRQKGLGRARHGSIRSPLWVGGGVVFGPKPRDYSFTLPKKVRKAGLRSALSLKLKENRLFIIDKIKLEEIKTKRFKEICERFEVEKVLFVIGEKDEKVEKSARNLPEVKVLRAEGINVRDLLRFEWLIMDLEAVKRVSEALG